MCVPFALLLAACASMKVNSYVERGANFRQFHTYDWGPADAGPSGDPRLDNNTVFSDRVRSQIEEQLTGRGFEKAPAGSSDLLLHYHLSMTQQVDVKALDPDYKRPDVNETRAYVFDAGTLVIDLVDRRTNALVWRGWAEGSFDGLIDNQDWLETHIASAVRRILERLPAL